jgi:hypothetical protein
MEHAMSPLTGPPDRVFVSVDARTGRSTISFFPAEVGAPYQFDTDPNGATAMAEAKVIAAKYPGCTVDGPHFHTSKEGGARRPRRRPA